MLKSVASLLIAAFLLAALVPPAHAESAAPTGSGKYWPVNGLTIQRYKMAPDGTCTSTKLGTPLRLQALGGIVHDRTGYQPAYDNLNNARGYCVHIGTSKWRADVRIQ